MTGRAIEQLTLGEAAEVSRDVKSEDITVFVHLIGDRNPVHSDPALMGQTRFGEPIVPGMWTASQVSAVIGTRLPGPGSIYASQDLHFLKPVKVGDTITARVEVIELIHQRNRVRLRTTCTNQRGEQVLSGEAWVLPPRGPVRAAPNRQAGTPRRRY
ncbi:MAG: MaoC family dehydratase [bacterium]